MKLVRPPEKYCPGHQGEAAKLDRERGTATERGYDPRWTKYSISFRRQYPLCGQKPPGSFNVGALLAAPGIFTDSACRSRGLIRRAQVVDHIFDGTRGTPLFWDPRNHQALCAECHDSKPHRLVPQDPLEKP